MEKILDIEPLSQRDSRWKNQRLGTVNGTTLGSHGCVVTCQAMILTFHGKRILPNELDDFLTNNNLYYQGNLWVPKNISKVWDKMKFVKTIYCEKTPTPIGDIKNAIDRNQPPTLWLMNEGVRHNVLAVGYKDNQIIVNDPWRGDRVNIKDRWGDSARVILSIDFYEGPGPTPMVQVPAPDFEGMVFKSTQHDKMVAYLELGDPQTTSFEEEQRVIAGYKSRITDLQNQLDAETSERKNREEQVSRLKDQLTESEKLRKELINKQNELVAASLGKDKIYEDKISVLQGQIDQMGKEKGELNKTIQTLNTALQNKEQKIAELMKNQVNSLTVSDVLVLLFNKLRQIKLT